MIVADSDILIDALAGRAPVASRVRDALSGGGIGTTAVTLFELDSGARTTKAREAVRTLLAALTVYAFDAPAADAAARIRRELEQAGRPIGMADYLIAGMCVARDAPLWTRNVVHFDRVPGLRIHRPT